MLGDINEAPVSVCSMLLTSIVLSCLVHLTVILFQSCSKSVSVVLVKWQDMIWPGFGWFWHAFADSCRKWGGICCRWATILHSWRAQADLNLPSSLGGRDFGHWTWWPSRTHWKNCRHRFAAKSIDSGASVSHFHDAFKFIMIMNTYVTSSYLIIPIIIAQQSLSNQHVSVSASRWSIQDSVYRMPRA